MTDKVRLTIARKWHNPIITHTINKDGISVVIDLEDFVEAVVREVGSVTWTFTDASFKKQLEDAVQRTVAGIKEETAKVM
jgi:hypothetical protein